MYHFHEEKQINVQSFVSEFDLHMRSVLDWFIPSRSFMYITVAVHRFVFFII